MPDDIFMVPHRLVPVSSCGRSMGEASPKCRYPDAVVAEARRLVVSGMSRRAAALSMGIPVNTVNGWFIGSRGEPAGTALRPVKP